MSNQVLVIAVHPDDETLGCGGTLLKHKKNQDCIHWLICTETSRDSDFYAVREHEINTVAKAYDFDSVHSLKLQSMGVDQYSMSEIIAKLSSVIGRAIAFKSC